jgi:hypothetical protein
MTDEKATGHLETIAFLLSSFTDNGRSLRAFETNPTELCITILTAGLLANSKLMISPDDAIRSSFDIHARIQKYTADYQSRQFVANIDNVFKDQHPEIEHD